MAKIERFETDEDFRGLYALADETGRLIGGFMRYLDKPERKGSKFKLGTQNSEP